jgi:TrmH RNA methyltransferase
VGVWRALPRSFLGAIARTAAFFSIERMVVSDPGQAGRSDASYRVAEGGLEYVELHRARRFARMIIDLRPHYRVIGAAAEGGHPPAARRRFPDRPIALVLGNEERGLPAATLKACEELVTIPGWGRLQSLNVAASAAIPLHALSDRASRS